MALAALLFFPIYPALFNYGLFSTPSKVFKLLSTEPSLISSRTIKTLEDAKIIKDYHWRKPSRVALAATIFSPRKD
jgi:hypothetical protein